MMARTHGLTDITHTLEETLKTMDGIDANKVIEEASQYSSRGKALLPLRPVFVKNEQFCKLKSMLTIIETSEWPMINQRAKEAERAAAIFQKRQQPELAESDDMFFDAKEYHTSNKQIANILTTSSAAEKPPEAQQAATAVSAAKWGDEDDLDLDDDLLLEETAMPQTQQEEESSEIFVPPSLGADPLI